jgi:DNA repair exonuclease SbcCD ATPase subunit
MVRRRPAVVAANLRFQPKPDRRNGRRPASRTRIADDQGGTPMSASQPTSDPNDTHDPTGTVAQFPLVLRGYDRHLVDVRLAELIDQLDGQRRRADDAEQTLQQLQQAIKAGRQLPAWFTSLGAEVRQVGEQAAAAAEQLLAEAGTRVQAAIDGAEAEAASRRQAAEEQAHNLEQRAQQTLAEAEAEADRRQAEATAAAERLIAEAETRAQEAMDEAAAQAAARLQAAEDQAGQLERSAQETLAQAQAERARMQAEATAAAEELRARAERDAAAMLEKAQEEATLAWQKAARERVLLEAETERLTTLRQRMVEQLGQVYAPLGLTLVDTRQELEPSNQGTLEAPTGQQDAPATALEPAELQDQPPGQQEPITEG